MSKPIRQGDILLTPVQDRSEVAKIRTYGRVKRVRNLGLVIAEGEATGHHHVVSTKGAKLYEKNGTLYLDVPASGAELEHDEHETITLEKGVHRVTRNQREYEPSAPRQQVRVFD